ncbi:tRNA 2-thiouridine(34) synthase MnmA [Blattabacterium cuenoti]|uniref:tRNA 2-thiouridine(34) synthase MnmA n=1 Tax=Blattabacterium cuenoti TaxID=1653831 RepID=UPI00163D0C28|nr:tRNA 2-thiouridine(34) synthase MnmA [Blattabacterium cuenoti]
MKKVVVAMSGGVDSSVSALILKKSGYEVIGMFMNYWNHLLLNNHCSLNQDGLDAMLIANQLNIPFHVLEMRNEYKKYVLNYMFYGYKIGYTPNPDILCNKKIKFHLFLKKAISLGADFIATGHYVKKKIITKNNKKIYSLLIGKDGNKDQSYFLCQLTQNQIKKTIFPLGSLTKKEVRSIAKKNGLSNAYKKESQGLCFLGKIQLSDFLSKKIPRKKGEIIYISSHSEIYKKENKTFSSKVEELLFLSKKKDYKKSNGSIIGSHEGAHFFTKGQRKGISLGGYKKALFVIDTDVKKNIVYTGMGNNHPGLYRKHLFIREDEIHWIRKDLMLSNGKYMDVFCRIRYRQPLQRSRLYKIKNGLLIEFEYMQRAITEGQFAAWYFNEELIGSGIIS